MERESERAWYRPQVQTVTAKILENTGMKVWGCITKLLLRFPRRQRSVCVCVCVTSSCPRWPLTGTGPGGRHNPSGWTWRDGTRRRLVPTVHTYVCVCVCVCVRLHFSENKCVASLTRRGTPSGTWGSSAALGPLLLLWHSCVPPLPLPPASADGLGRQTASPGWLEAVCRPVQCLPLLPSSPRGPLPPALRLMTPAPPSCGGAELYRRVLVGTPSRRRDFARCETTPVRVGRVPRAPAGRSRYRRDLDSVKSSEKVARVQERERPRRRGHTTTARLASRRRVSKGHMIQFATYIYIYTYVYIYIHITMIT